jgi:hypothetical protein
LFFRLFFNTVGQVYSINYKFEVDGIDLTPLLFKELANFKLEQEFLTRPPSRISISPSPEPETSPNQKDSSPITALQTPSERGGKS